MDAGTDGDPEPRMATIAVPELSLSRAKKDLVLTGASHSYKSGHQLDWEAKNENGRVASPRSVSIHLK